MSLEETNPFHRCCFVPYFQKENNLSKKRLKYFISHNLDAKLRHRKKNSNVSYVYIYLTSFHKHSKSPPNLTHVAFD